MRKTLFLVALILFMFQVKGQQIRLGSIEPPYWMDGFHNKDFLLLVNGKNISLADISSVAEHVKLNKVITLDNPDYVLLLMSFTTDEPLPESFPIFFSKDKKSIAEYLFEIKAGPSPQNSIRQVTDPVFISPSKAGFYQIDPRYQPDSRYLFLTDTLHGKNKQLVFVASLAIGSGHPWKIQPPLKRWVNTTTTSRTSESSLVPDSYLERYLLQNCLWWLDQLHPDAVCVEGNSAEALKFRKLLKAELEVEMSGFPTTDACNTR
ncbi:MAG: cyclomaltodextrinase N-terminal domain-containing protein [Syntrophothermus sp.]